MTCLISRNMGWDNDMPITDNNTLAIGIQRQSYGNDDENRRTWCAGCSDIYRVFIKYCIFFLYINMNNNSNLFKLLIQKMTTYESFLALDIKSKCSDRRRKKEKLSFFFSYFLVFFCKFPPLTISRESLAQIFGLPIDWDRHAKQEPFTHTCRSGWYKFCPNASWCPNCITTFWRPIPSSAPAKYS